MQIIIGADLVPTESNFDLFKAGDAMALVMLSCFITVVKSITDIRLQTFKKYAERWLKRVQTLLYVSIATVLVVKKNTVTAR